MTEHPIVACYRGRDSIDAIQLGSLLAGALDEPLVLVSARRYEPLGLSARAGVHPYSDRRAIAAQAARRHTREFARADVEVRERALPSERIADGLVALARDLEAGAVVVGPDTQGHVTRSLMRRAPCPIAVAPRVARTPMAHFERIGVAYDGSPAAQRALVTATGLALATRARLVLLAAGPTTEHTATWLEMARASLEGALESPQVRALVGDPASALALAGDELDLLVCGSRARSRSLVALLGSVSTDLVAHARCPVLVVPDSSAVRAAAVIGGI
jgi:nucleotide-binding universal stress UspA family protein